MSKKLISYFIVFSMVVSMSLITSFAANSITHESESNTNNLKYAKIESNYVKFEERKDAYIEMKKVGSPSSGNVTVEIVYSNGSSKDLPMEIKVNSVQIEKNKMFSPTGSWGAFKSLNITANMESGSNNVVRIKTRSSDGGPYIDKIIVKSSGSDDSNDDSDDSSDDGSNNDSDPVDGDIILEPNGSMTLSKAINSIKAGKTIYLKNGTYKFSKTIVIEEGNNGTSSNMKKIYAYGNAKPVIDFSSMSESSSNRGFVLAGKYWHFKGITIKGAGDNGMLLAGHNNKIERCTFRENHDTGLQLSRYKTSYSSISKWPSNNTIVDCISTENIDSGREDADGYAPKLTCGKGNKFKNCKALYNCDDGWDMYTKSSTGAIGVITLENCEATGNGKFTNGSSTKGDGNGFKLGDDTASVAHILKNCVANNNRKHGFTGNGNPAKIILQNCSGSGNGGKLFTRLDNAIIN